MDFHTIKTAIISLQNYLLSNKYSYADTFIPYVTMDNKSYFYKNNDGLDSLFGNVDITVRDSTCKAFKDFMFNAFEMDAIEIKKIIKVIDVWSKGSGFNENFEKFTVNLKYRGGKIKSLNIKFGQYLSYCFSELYSYSYFMDTSVVQVRQSWYHTDRLNSVTFEKACLMFTNMKLCTMNKKELQNFKELKKFFSHDYKTNILNNFSDKNVNYLDFKDHVKILENLNPKLDVSYENGYLIFRIPYGQNELCCEYFKHIINPDDFILFEKLCIYLSGYYKSIYSDGYIQVELSEPSFNLMSTPVYSISFNGASFIYILFSKTNIDYAPFSFTARYNFSHIEDIGFSNNSHPVLPKAVESISNVFLPKVAKALDKNIDTLSYDDLKVYEMLNC
jgi:hypothetical protein